jgi:hypothetical protein
VDVESVLMRWNKLGAAFNVRACESTPDIEKLLLDTAFALPENARLFPVVVSWLCRNYRLVCRHRLAGFAGQIGEKGSLAVLGLILDVVKSRLGIEHFNVVIRKCSPLKDAMPLFAVDRSSEAFTAMAGTGSGEMGIKWGLWCEDVQLKDDVIKSAKWIMAENSHLMNRAVFNGNLRASILETLAYDTDAGQSESVLANRCSVTRKALREALDHLEYCQMIQRSNIAGRVRINVTCDF